MNSCFRFFRVSNNRRIFLISQSTCNCLLLLHAPQHHDPVLMFLVSGIVYLMASWLVPLSSIFWIYSHCVLLYQWQVGAGHAAQAGWAPLLLPQLKYNYFVTTLYLLLMIPKRENEFCHQVSDVLLPLSLPKRYKTPHSDHYSYFWDIFNVHILLLVKALVVADAAVVAAEFVIRGATICWK